MDNHHYTKIKFLGKDLDVLTKDSRNPIFLMFLANIELVEIKFSEGTLWLDKLKSNYKIRFGDEKVEDDIRKIIRARHQYV